MKNKEQIDSRISKLEEKYKNSRQDLKLILHEQKQQLGDKSRQLTFFIEKGDRINSYYTALTSSFNDKRNGVRAISSIQNGLIARQRISIGTIVG